MKALLRPVYSFIWVQYFRLAGISIGREALRFNVEHRSKRSLCGGWIFDHRGLLNLSQWYAWGMGLMVAIDIGLFHMLFNSTFFCAIEVIIEWSNRVFHQFIFLLWEYIEWFAATHLGYSYT